ncbi:equilibrative nucleotide transporter 8-like [Macadamia integrifolia]|uniref:equilibrative nucleotide transporter 8-like n=1 Tax=Macadamia integrifolia TaxID=60698 RepID=UPI001C4FCB58|nr:equilibrative nucleotide transporter 8-like [Macadamia integrifolia]
MERVKGPDDDQTEPRDAFNMAYIIHFVLGAGNLLPWNALITAVDYFSYLYPDEHVYKVFAIAYMGSSLLVLVLLLSWGGWSKRQGFRLRMNLRLSMFVLSLMMAPLLDWTYHGRRSHGAYTVTVAAVELCGLADGLIGGSLIGSTGKLPERYMQAVFAGTASSVRTSTVYVPKTIGKTTWACILRILFYPLFTACLHGPKQLRTEVPVIFLIGMLGLSNGYLTSVLMILAPKSVLVEEAVTVGVVMALFLVIGLVIGSVLGWFWII